MAPPALPAPPLSPTPETAHRSRARAVGVHAAGAVVVAAAAARLHVTGGYAVAPGDLLSCPLHTVTGLWCPFCGGLRCGAALTHGDLASALSFNVVVVALLPVVGGLWLWSMVAAARKAEAAPRVTNRGWVVLLAVLLVFTVWRNVPAVPLAAYLAP